MAQPDLIPAPFAENATPGTIEPIPPLTPSVPQQATWSSGFPQVTMQPLAAGGIPPRGQDFNGVLNALSQHIFHMQGGGQYKWSDDHGPYSIGDVLQSDDGLRSYVSVVDNNTDNFNTNPSSIGVSWLPWSAGPASESEAGVMKIATTSQAQSLTADDVVLTPKKLSDAFKGANQSLSSPGRQKFPGGLMIQSFSLSNTNNAGTGFSTSPLPVSFPNGVIGLTASTRTTSPAFIPYHVSVVNPGIGTISWVVYDMAGTPISTPGTVTTDFIILGH